MSVPDEGFQKTHHVHLFRYLRFF